MTTYVDLGSRGPVKGAADTSGLNPGNWSITFDPATLAVSLPQFEVYKMVVSGAANTTFKVYRESKQWDVGVYGTLNSWDPQQPLLMHDGETLLFAYSDPVTDGTPPSATIWLRYDQDIQANKEAVLLWVGGR